MRKLLLLGVSLMFLQGCCQSFCDGAKSKEVVYIQRDQLAKWLESGENVALVDVLSAESYGKAHIKGAISIPLGEIKERSGELKQYDKIVVYCASFSCHASTKAAALLMELGFENVFDYEGGLKDWKDAGLPLGSS